MRHLPRSRRAAVVAALVVAPVMASVGGVTAAEAAVPAKAGLVGSPILLQDNAQFDGYDVATDGAGNAYIGWIANTDPNDGASRAVHLCTLHPGGTSCVGGIQVIDALDSSGAEGLRVLATSAGAVTLVWFHDTSPGSISGPRGGEIAIATSQSGGPLTGPTDVADAPSFGQLLDAEYGPGGALWTVAEVGVGTSSIEVREGVQNPQQTVATPYSVGSAQLAFAGTTPVIAIQQYGSVTAALATAHGVGGGFSGFTNVAHTWTADGNAALLATRSGVRLMASEDDADYFPVVAKWTGAGFAKPHLTGDHNACAPNSHDLATDASGRLADVADECGQITVSNLPATTTAGVVRFSARGIVASGTPQIATTPRGHAFVAWSVESSTSNRLYVGRVLLPGLTTAASRISGKGRVTVSGPASCQPASTFAVAVKGSATKGWRVATATLALGGKTLVSSTTIDGSKLTPNTVYALVGRVVFTKAGLSRVGTETLKFRSCANP
jgi:hypothetical protein